MAQSSMSTPVSSTPVIPSSSVTPLSTSHTSTPIERVSSVVSATPTRHTKPFPVVLHSPSSVCCVNIDEEVCFWASSLISCKPHMTFFSWIFLTMKKSAKSHLSLILAIKLKRSVLHAQKLQCFWMSSSNN